MLPEGADAVVMLEYTAEHPDLTLEVRRAVAPGENLLTPGEMCRPGSCSSSRGRGCVPRTWGYWRRWESPVKGLKKAPGGHPLLRRRDRPGGAAPGPGQVRDANAHLTAAQVREGGGLPLLLGIIPDDFAALRAALAAAEQATPT